MESDCSVGTGFSFGVMKRFWKSVEVVVHNVVNVLNATALFTLKWLIFSYGNFTPVKKN